VLKNLYYTSIVLFLLADFSPKISAQEVRRFTENEFRTRYYNLVDELRCPKCQNQNLADSNSLIAIDLRNEIHSMLEDGRTNKEIIEFLVDRYGEYVRYNPSLNSKTMILWFAPVFLFFLGIAIILYVYKSRLLSKEEISLKPHEKEYLDNLVINSSNSIDSNEIEK
jgi:cytochrome c-type biogenesis protein CcmH|tara:strand:+ start:7517 stop:8017 length:501 start_codon:yes stop_codon:yes gene_type:complete